MPDLDEGLNIEEAAASISADLFGAPEEAPDPVDPPAEAAPETVVEEVPADPALEQAQHSVPRSWAKETHELWTKIPAEAQAQILHREKQMLEGLEGYKQDAGLGKSLREVISPYRPMIEAHGIDETKAVASLFNTHYRLTQGPLEQRQAAFKMLGEGLGLVAKTEGPTETPGERELRERLARLEGSLTEREQRAFNEHKAKVSNDVQAFASATGADGKPLHPHFDECAEDIVAFLQQGASLEDAYKKAVYANPVTREKQLAQFRTEQEAALRNKAKQEAEAAKKAASTNVRGRDTRKSPTEALGTMEDTMKATLADMRTRTH